MWYYNQNGQQFGPVNQTDFENMIRSGMISPQTPVWKAGMTNWKVAGQIPEFTSFFVNNPPPLPKNPVGLSSPDSQRNSTAAVSQPNENPPKKKITLGSRIGGVLFGIVFGVLIVIPLALLDGLLGLGMNSTIRIFQLIAAILCAWRGWVRGFHFTWSMKNYK